MLGDSKGLIVNVVSIQKRYCQFMLGNHRESSVRLFNPVDCLWWFGSEFVDEPIRNLVRFAVGSK